MSKFIGRKFNIGIGKESTRGTAVAASFWLPKMDGVIDDRIDAVIDNSSIGIIEDGQSSDIVKKFSEGTLSGRLNDLSFGLLTLATLGSETATTLVATGVYDHVFNILESAQHPALTFAVNEPNATSDRYALGMIDSLELAIETGKYAMYTIGFTANTPSTTSNTPSYAAENIFLPQHCTVKITPTLATIGGAQTATGTAATTVNVTALSINTNLIQVGMGVTGTNVPAGATVAAIVGTNAFTLSIATTGAMGTITFVPPAVNTRKINIKVSKNIEDDPTIGNVSPVDRYNKQFAIEGTLELVYDDQSYIDTFMLGDQAKALRIVCTNTDTTIGASSNPTITIDLARAKIQEVSKSVGNDEIVTQTIKFKAFYSIADSKMTTWTIRNTQTAAY